MTQQTQQVLDMHTLINKPFFSIVIPTYNPQGTLSRLLQSIVDQELTKEELEVIVSDDCSTVDNDQIINSFKDKLNIKKISTPYNGGTGNARQWGVEHITGEYVTFIDQDDVYVPKVFQKVKQLLKDFIIEKYFA